MEKSKFLEILLTELPAIKDQHVTSSSCYNILRKMARSEVAELFNEQEKGPKNLGPFGAISLPYFKMGAIDSLDLFGLDELIIFSFYWKNRHKYKRVLDIGGNIGLHSIVLSKSGFEVKVFEPDPTHFAVLSKNLSLNQCDKVTAFNAAVSNRSGTAEFTRVLGNTTSSHLSGSKQPYGDLEQVTVKVEDIRDLISWADLIKMDVEGHEKDILLATTKDHWSKIDAVVEIGSVDNAKFVYDHLKSIGVGSFAQKKGWEKVTSLADMPTSHRDGSLFITVKDAMPW